MITELQKKLMQLRLELRDVLKDSNPEDYYRIRELVIESEEILSRHSEEEIPEEEIPKQNQTEFLLEDTKAFDESKLFDMNCCIPNMCNVIAPTGEAISSAYPIENVNLVCSLMPVVDVTKIIITVETIQLSTAPLTV